jgi:hypothetical protein
MAIGTAAAISLGSTALSAGMSFLQADEQRREQRKADAAAIRAMEQARQRLGVNYKKALSIQKEPYELQREAMLSQGALALMAGQESDRGAEATAGKVQMALNQAQAGIRSDMGKDLMDIEQQIVDEDSRLRDLNVQLDLGEVEGQQTIAREAEQRAAEAQAEGISGAISTLEQGLVAMSLFGKNDLEQSTLSDMQLNKGQFEKFDSLGKTPGTSESLDFDKIKGMNNKDFRKFRRGLTPKQLQLLQEYSKSADNYNPFALK